MQEQNRFIEVSSQDQIAHLRFNRPRQLNAFNNELMRETLAAVTALEQDEDIRVIIVFN